MSKNTYLSEAEVRSQRIDPQLKASGWDFATQVREEYYVNDGRVKIKRGKGHRGEKQYVDYLLCIRPGIPIALIEAKDGNHAVGAGMQQGQGYARRMDIPFVFSSNGKGFLFYDNTGADGPTEREIQMEAFPSPTDLWDKFRAWRSITPEEEETILQDYYFDATGRAPRYYQTVAINRTVEAVVKGRDRILLVMATGTGKTFTAFNIIYRLWRARNKQRILFLADRTALIDQTRRGDFRHFKDKMTIIKKTVVDDLDRDGNATTKLVSNGRAGISAADKAYEIFLGLYQGLTNAGGTDAFRDFTPDFFDLIVVDECHRGSARANSPWREILSYFSSATQIGLTATPRETEEVSNSDYFGDPIYTYTLAQGIDDGYLSPYRVLRVGLNVDLEEYRPPRGKRDKNGELLDDRIYTSKDFDRLLVIDERTAAVARTISDYLRRTGRYQKTIVFCVDIDHAERLRQALANENSDLMRRDHRYVLRMTGDSDKTDKDELDNFCNPEERYPVIVTTSKLLNTGIDAKTCQLIVLDNLVESMTEFKQIIGRGTRIDEDYGKLFFTIMDFRNRTRLFYDPTFDGPAERVMDITTEELDEAIDELENTEEEVTDTLVSGWGSLTAGTLDDMVSDRERKRYIDGVAVEKLVEREIVFDEDGRPVTVNLRDYSRERVQEKFPTLEDFLHRWTAAARKTAIVQELIDAGLPLDKLREAVGEAEVDPFDLICHVAYDKKPLTRSERARAVRQSSYFDTLGETARGVLLSLLDKYATEGLDNLEDINVLKLHPFDGMGTPLEIVRNFGGKAGYQQAVRKLESEIYRVEEVA